MFQRGSHSSLPLTTFILLDRRGVGQLGSRAVGGYLRGVVGRLFGCSISVPPCTEWMYSDYFIIGLGSAIRPIEIIPATVIPVPTLQH